ncbi:MAG: archease [Chloroflexi bacterium]|nr:archease [Chloroflexota bacterium]
MGHGFAEVEHTADWAIRVWAEDLPQLLSEAARGMYALAQVQISAGPRIPYRLELPVEDEEGLLVAFLSELLYISEQRGLAFDQFDLVLQEKELCARLVGAPIRRQSREIKAVTFHNLRVVHTGNGLEATVVFDV